MKFNRIRSLTNNSNELIKSIQNSEIVEISQDLKHIRKII